MPSHNTSPIFIGGLMKSGTSLLRKLLSLHPNIFGGLETFWFTNDFTDHWQDGNSTRQKWLKDFFEVTEEECQKIREQSDSPYHFFAQFMGYCASRENKVRWVEKTPDNVFYIEKILDKWPDAKLLIMERDLMDVYASWKKNNKRTFEIFLETAAEYQRVQDKWKAANDKVKFITYKELVTNPKETLQKVLSFIGEEYIEGLENYQGDDTDYKKVLTITGKLSTTTESLKKPIFTSSIGSWKKLLSPSEIQMIKKINHPI